LCSAPAVKRPPTAPQVTYLTSKELERIKSGVVVKTPEELELDRERTRREKEERERTAKARNARMKELEIKAESKKVKSDLEVADLAKAEAIRKLAEDKIDKDNDMVRMLDSLASRAIAFTVRDEQLRDKEHREKAEAAYQRRMDMEMELDRVKELKRRTDEDKKRAQKREEDRKVINEQMEWRHRQHLLALEAKERENMMVKANTERYLAEDREKARLRAIAVEKSKEEVRLANEAAIRKKREDRENEKKEVQDILLYQKMQDAKMRQRELDEIEIANQKKETQKKLLAQQERAQDNRGKMDEIRARRAMEEHERRARQKERAEALKKKREEDELVQARAKQAQEKRERLEREKKELEREHYQMLLHVNKVAEREQGERNTDSKSKEYHRVALRNQIAEREAARKGVKDDDADIGLRRRQEYIREEAKLKVIRDKMLKDMEEAGVNPKYLGEMKNIDIAKAIRR
jgi:hypothetical protein